jgi:hypothetical protein
MLDIVDEALSNAERLGGRRDGKFHVKFADGTGMTGILDPVSSGAYILIQSDSPHRRVIFVPSSVLYVYPA